MLFWQPHPAGVVSTGNFTQIRLSFSQRLQDLNRKTKNTTIFNKFY